MISQRKLFFTYMCLFAFAGGMTVQYFTHAFVPPSYAQQITNVRAPQSYRDVNGKVRLAIGIDSDEPQESMIGEDGKPRIWLGMAVETGEEQGLPALKLYDNEGRLRTVLRIAAGKNQAPVLEMKDSKGRDRIVMGLGSEDATEDPFLVYMDKDDQKHSVFGTF